MRRCAAVTLSLASVAVAADEPVPVRPIVIPIQIKDNFPLLTASVDGVSVPLKFDLGDGDALVLQQGLLAQIGAVPTGEVAKMRGVDGVFEAPLYKIPRVQIGTAIFSEVVARADVRAGSYQPGGQGEKGYMGTGLLKEYIVAIDYQGRSMTLISGVDERDGAGACNGTVVPFLPEWNGAPVTEAQTDWGQAIVWWDTGSPVSSVSRTFAEKYNLRLSGSSATTSRFVLGGAEFGPMTFDVWDMDLPKFDGWVAYDFFARHVVCVDFPRSQLIIGMSDRAADSYIQEASTPSQPESTPANSGR